MATTRASKNRAAQLLDYVSIQVQLHVVTSPPTPLAAHLGQLIKSSWREEDRLFPCFCFCFFGSHTYVSLRGTAAYRAIFFSR